MMNKEFYMFDIWILKAFQCKIYESPEACDVLFYYNTYFTFHFCYHTPLSFLANIKFIFIALTRKLFLQENSFM